MGYLTTITIHNDALGAFQKDPEEFGKAILKGLNDANFGRVSVDVPFKNYGGYITVEPSRHADDHTVFVHYGNTVTGINKYDAGMRSLIKNNPDYAKKLLKVAKGIVKEAEEAMKKA